MTQIIPLKFRGIPIQPLPDGKNWIYGNHIQMDYEAKKAYINQKEVRFDTVGQSIGKLDKKQDEIYDGDLLDLQNGASDDSEHFLAQIHRHDASFNVVEPIYHNTIIAQPVPHFISQTGTILGNIHEHKDRVPEWKRQIEKNNTNRF